MLANKENRNIQLGKIKENYGALWSLLTKEQKNKFKIVLLLLVMSSFFEILSLGSLLPFIAAIISPETIHSNEYTKDIVDVLGWHNKEQVQLNLTIMYISVVSLAGLFRIWLNVFEVRLIYSVGSMISCDIYRSYLMRSYSDYVLSNSSEILSDLTHKVGELISSWLIPTVNLLVAVVLLIVTVVTLVLINPYLMLSTFVVFGAIYLATIRYFKASVQENTEVVAMSAEKIIKEIQEASGNIRDILLHERQSQYSVRYNFLEKNLRSAQAQVQILSFMPKTIIETMGIVFIAILAFILSVVGDGMGEVVVGLGLVAIGVQKILPLLNQIYNSYIVLSIGMKVGGKLLSRNECRINKSEYCDAGCLIEFSSCIRLDDLYFSYPGASNAILDEVNLTIEKNSCIGLVGKSGSGKSTLADILLGMLMPSDGSVFVDEVLLSSANIKKWRAKVAHVPQSVYLLDDTILKNVAMNSDVDGINHERLEYALHLASLWPYVSEQKDGVMSLVGERGVRLSGGQRQRIGIARAIYEGAEFLVFDEPTSALDPETECAIMDAISKLIGSVTIVIISHNYNSLKMCDRIIKLENGKVVDVDVYK